MAPKCFIGFGQGVKLSRHLFLKLQSIIASYTIPEWREILLMMIKWFSLQRAGEKFYKIDSLVQCIKTF
jgi:hypothetical protein